MCQQGAEPFGCAAFAVQRWQAHDTAVSNQSGCVDFIGLCVCRTVHERRPGLARPAVAKHAGNRDLERMLGRAGPLRTAWLIAVIPCGSATRLPAQKPLGGALGIEERESATQCDATNDT